MRKPGALIGFGEGQRELAEDKTEVNLPSAMRFRMQVLRIDQGIGMLMGLLIFLVVHPVVKFTPDQLRFLLVLAGILVVGLGLLSFIFQQRSRLDPMLHWLKTRKTRDVPEAERLRVFNLVTDYPKFMVLFMMQCYFGGCCFVVFMMNWKFDSFDLLASAYMIVGSVSVGFLAQLLSYTFLRNAFEPLRNQLAIEIEDPDLRQQAASHLSLRTKMFSIIAGISFVTAFIMLSMGYGHAYNSTERFSQQARLQMLEFVGEHYEDGPLPYILEETARRYDRSGIHLIAVDPEGETLYGSTDLLPAEDLATFLSTGAASGDAMDFRSERSFAWSRFSEEGPYVLAVTDPEWIETAGITTDKAIPIMAIFSIAVALLAAFFVSRDFGRSAAILDGNLRRIAEGDLLRSTVFESEDEFGELSRSMDRTSSSLRNILLGMVRAATNVEGTTREIDSAMTDITHVTSEQVSAVGRTTYSMEMISMQVAGITRSSLDLGESIQDSTEAVIKLEESGSELNHSATALGQRADESSSSLEEMSSSIRLVIENTKQLDQSMLEASTNVQGLASAITQVESSASESANFSTRVIEIADHGQERVQQTIEGIEVIRANTTEANMVIGKLGERGQEIGAIIDVISDVADETNLLALNASIIAAQAGTHGKAFAVVANQIKELADRVLKSTQEITGLIQGLQEGTVKAVETMDRGSESVRVGVEVAAEAGVSLQEITEAARLSGERTSQIVDAMRAQAISADAVRDLMAHVTLQVEEIRHTGEKQVTGSESNLQAALVVGGIAKELQQAAEDQTTGTGKIRGNMGQVRESVDEINEALQEQSRASQEILSSTEAIQGLTTSNEVSVDAMRNVMERLNQQALDLRAELMRFKF